MLTSGGLRPQRRRWRRLPGEGDAGQQGGLQAGHWKQGSGSGKAEQGGGGFLWRRHGGQGRSKGQQMHF
ncbi:hypothetical protein E2562_016466 [Oryza meyeriana var. granulata]|uniref:Uncharacterized protein n=1 Tax=Oryza meyeriana var. granulata TaxID=110450 RepID=A0A6G1BMP4_9ORYZ|nr:hypothetical protein E2562_016466 [Oryza meyeriana var. granulata]